MSTGRDRPDVNEKAVTAWVDETTPFERVRTVMKRTYEPQPVAEVAERARTTPTTARKHLEQLVESGYVEATATPEREGTLYRRSNESLVLEQARDLLAEADTQTLVARIAEMQAEVGSYRDATGAESPEDAVLSAADVDRATLRQWQTTRRNLGIARAALALSEARKTVQVNSL